MLKTFLASKTCFLLLLLSSVVFAEGNKDKTSPLPKNDEKTVVAKKPVEKTAKEVVAPKKTGLSGKENFQLISIEEKTNRLKERIFRSKARLMLLEETVLSGSLTTAKLKLEHKNEMSGAFYMTQASYSLDGKSIFFRLDHEGSLNKAKKITIFQGMLQPGPHTLDVLLEYRGNGGVFSYINGYQFKIRRQINFKVKAGVEISVRSVAFEKNRLTTRLEKRPSMRFDIARKRIFKKKNK